MGIQGLLPFLKSIQRETHVSSFRGRKVAIDGYCWLHKGAYSCAMQLVMKTEKLETLPFIKYCMKRVNMLLRYDITPVMVFDGGYLPVKAATETERRERRQVNLQKGKTLLKEGRKSEAMDCFQRSVDVSPEMALALIKECRKAGVECIVAPYEADSQLAYLSKEGIVDLVITEDSDLLVFGCKKVMFKLDDSGNGKLIEISELGRANKGLVGFTVDSFRQMCILSGCDYLPSVPGIGLGKALKLMRRFNKNPYRVIKSLQYETGKVPVGYEENFRRADHTFLYQVVFDPRTQQQVRLNEVPCDIDPASFEFAGTEFSPRKAVGMARGNINPLNHSVMDFYSPSKAPPPKSTSWSGSVMGSANNHYPVGPQSKTTLTSSDGCRNHFKPPKRSKPKQEVLATDSTDGVKDEDLQTIYLSASMTDEPWHPSASGSPPATETSPTIEEEEPQAEKPQKVVVTKSRFFSSQSSVLGSEETPSESDLLQQLKIRRKLSLMPQTDSGTRTEPRPSENPPFPADSVPESPAKSVPMELQNSSRKRLHFSSDGPSLQQRLQEEFGYSKVKRFKPAPSVASHPLPRLDGAGECVVGDTSGTHSPLKNPFAKILPQKPAASNCALVQKDRVESDHRASQADSECSESNDTRSLGTSPSLQDSGSPGVSADPQAIADRGNSPSLSSESLCTTGSVTATDIHPPQPFMTSADFITTPATVRQQSSATGTFSESSLSTHQTIEQFSAPPLRPQQRQTSGKKKLGTKGVSKTAAANSRFKTPKRSGSEPGLKQLSLVAQFAYVGRPRMSREH